MLVLPGCWLWATMPHFHLHMECRVLTTVTLLEAETQKKKS